MQEFEYGGKHLHELSKVSDIKDLDKQIDEIEKRFKALREWAVDNHLVLTPLHLTNVLNTNKTTFEKWRRGLVMVEGKSRPVEEGNFDKSVIRLVRLRADLITAWCEYCRQWCLDAVASDNVPSRSIYLSKAIFHNWDTPQEKKDGKVGVEVLLSKSKKKAK